MDYAEFIQLKTHIDTRDGFKPTYFPDQIFDFQSSSPLDVPD